jgi:hypothetical protein
LLPIELCFHPAFGHSTWWKPIEYFIEAFFCMDVLAHFNTTIYDHDGNETADRFHIGHHYLTSHHFWIDMLATIPIPVDNPIVKLFPTLKVIRITSLSLIIQRLDVTDEKKAVSLYFYFYPHL